MTALEKNNMKAYYAETKEEVVPLIKTLLNKGETVSNGGSETLFETGVFSEILESGDYDFGAAPNVYQSIRCGHIFLFLKRSNRTRRAVQC